MLEVTVAFLIVTTLIVPIFVAYRARSRASSPRRSLTIVTIAVGFAYLLASDNFITQWLFISPGIRPGIVQSQSGLDLRRAKLTGARISGVDLPQSDLQEASLFRADLTGSNLEKSNLSHADLASANLAGTNLANARLEGANLTGANLTGANLTGANLIGADLREAIGLSADQLCQADLDENTTRLPRVPGFIWAECKPADPPTPATSPPDPEPHSFDPVLIRGVNFSIASSTLEESAKQSLQSIAKVLGQNSLLKLEIIGHADSVGTVEFNRDLSLSRANAVKDYLSSLGVEQDRLIIRGEGESKPVSSNNRPSGRALNRRVEFLVTLDRE